MGVEVAGADLPLVSVETKDDIDNSYVHVEEIEEKISDSEHKEGVKFENDEEAIKVESVDASESTFPKDAVDEWPAVKQVHSFYFVRLRPYDDPKVKGKIVLADKEIQKKNKSRLQITEELRAKRVERSELKNTVRALITDSQKYKEIMKEKRMEMGPLQQALGNLRNSNNSGRVGICSSEGELNDLIYSLKYRIQHESIPLSEEKQILREIKMLEGTREKVIANAALRAKIEDTLGQKEAIQDQVKLMGVNLDGVKKEQQAVSSKITQLDEKIKVIDNEIKALQDELNVVIQKRDEAYDSIRALRTQKDEGNTLFYQSRMIMTQAKERAAAKDIKGLEELCSSEVEKFMSIWNSNKAFRDDYEKRILPSLDMRQMSRDGRIRNPGEKPLVAEVAVQVDSSAVANATATAPAPANAKRAKEEPQPVPQKDILPASKKEISKKEAAVPEDAAINDGPDLDLELRLPTPVEKVVDEAKLKELKREEELAKAKQAMERKKKLAEKAAAKAAIKAQKEAEKKLKEREKKLRKKAAASAPANDSAESTEVAEEEVEAEAEESKVNEEVQAAAAKPNVRGKEKALRYRPRPRAGERLPKSILQKRKSFNYLMWASGAAALAVILIVLGYFFMF